ncbi:serine/threonine protein kinase, partial [Sphaeroforma arctica JP610]
SNRHPGTRYREIGHTHNGIQPVVVPPLLYCESMGSLGVHIFTAISLSGAERADNGLPYTPYSVNMTGRFESLKGIRHPHLCEYIDLVIGDHERVMVVSEAYTTTLSDVIASGVPIPEDQIRHWTVQIVCALHHLNTLGTCHRHLSPESIQLTIPYEMRKTWTDSAEEKSSTHSSLSRTESMGQAARFDDGTDNIGAAQRPGSQDTRQRCCRRECTPDKFIIQPTGATRTRPTTDAEHTNGCQCKPSRHKGPEGTKFSGGDVRLSGYGDFYLTANGAEVAFPFGVPEYMAPELLALEFAKASTDPGSVIPVHTTHPVLSVDPKGRHIPLPGCHSDCDETSAVGNVASDVVVDAGANPKFDVWALGLILLELTLGSYLWQRDRGATADTAARSTGNNNLRSDKDIRNADRRNASEYGTSHHDGKHSNGGDSRKKSSLGEAKGSRYGPASVRADGNQGNASRPVRKSEDLEELLCDILMLAQDVPLDVGGTADEDCVGVGIGGEKSADQDDKSFSVLPGERYSTRSALQKICMSHAALLEERFADCFNRDTGVVNLPMSDEMRDFISLCLRIRPGERPTPGQLLQHPFLNM